MARVALRLAVLVGVVTASVTAVSSAGATKQDNFACPPSFTRVTPEEGVLLERTQLAINDGAIDAVQALAGWEAIDANGSGYVCYQLPHGFEVSSAPGSQYYYNTIDDNASAPS